MGFIIVLLSVCTCSPKFLAHLSLFFVCVQTWIYRQICNSGCPLHPLLPSLIEVYVNSIIIKSTKTDHLNEPLTDQDVLDVYKSSVFSSTKGENSVTTNLTPQLILLYYLLLYEDTVLNNMKIICKL